MTSQGYYDLLDAFQQSGCAVCHLLRRDEKQYLSSLLYEYVTEWDVHQAMRAARGFCARHAAQLKSTGEGVLGIAVLYVTALDEVIKTLDAAPTAAPMLKRLSGQSAATTLSAKLANARDCPCCQAMHAAEGRYLDILVAGLEKPEFLAAYQHSSGVCLPHLRRWLPLINDANQLKQVVAHQQTVWANLKAELQLFIAKYGADWQGEPIGAEGDAWARAILALAGNLANS
jgi:hypothetical protein